MLTVFILIGWIDGNNSGGVLSQEFSSLERCEVAKTLFIQKNQIKVNTPIEDRYSDDSWVECVKK
jgi:hypothetical protein